MLDYKGIYPALYACYDDNGKVSTERTKQLVRFLIDNKVNGIYACGSSGECIYQSVDERKQILQAVMEEKKGSDIKIIAHVACNNTSDSRELAAHAESLKVDAIAAIPPIYFRLPEHAVAKYWNDISEAAPNTDFFIYNIPQLAGAALTGTLLNEMKKNKNVVGVKNSSMPTMDISTWRSHDVLVFNGPDEQLLSGLATGSVGGIGGTFGAMPQLYVALYENFSCGNLKLALQLQEELLKIINVLVGSTSSMYSVIKEVLRINNNINIGDVREPMPKLDENGKKAAQTAVNLINEANRLI